MAQVSTAVEFGVMYKAVSRAFKQLGFEIPDATIQSWAKDLTIEEKYLEEVQSHLVRFVKEVLTTEPEIQEWQKVDRAGVVFPATWWNAILHRFIPRRLKWLRGKITYVEVDIKTVYQRRFYNQCPHSLIDPEGHETFLLSNAYDNYAKATPLNLVGIKPNSTFRDRVRYASFSSLPSNSF